ncbi:MAG TPA: hypothetical protein VMF61_05115 [Candidatus Acidoferrales bacterium]|nr:hypothetical protein [Candidatus Acidoferrales bacterium]
MTLGPVPLVVGVAGHRDLPSDAGPLRDCVRATLREMRDAYPNTPIVLLSALAEGADRLVASEGLDLGFALRVPLPMEIAEYERDFESEASKVEFRALLARAESSFVVRPRDGERTDYDRAETRAAAYANCAAYIVRHCVELVALWDGLEGGKGGTADIVSFQLEGLPAPYVPESVAFDASMTGPVIQLVTPRVAGALGKPVQIRLHYPESAITQPEKAFARAKFGIERFNAEVVRRSEAGGFAALPIDKQAEALANLYQRRTNRALLAIFLLVFAAAVGFAIYTAVPNHPLGILIGYVALSAAAFAVYRASRRGEWEERHQDFRALEQLLRISRFWKLAGIDESPALHFARQERTTIDWIAMALRALTEFSPPSEDRPHESALRDTLPIVSREWVDDQYAYYSTLVNRRLRVRERTASVLATAAILGSIALTIAANLASEGAGHGGVTVVLVVAAALAIAAALVHDFAEKRGWSEHIRHYELMALLFGQARLRIARVLSKPQPSDEDYERLRAVLRILGIEAIRENVAWLNLHRSRPIRVPAIVGG